MNKTLESLKTQLTRLIAQVNAKIPTGQAFGSAHNNWSFPGLTSEELAAEAQSLVELIDDTATMATWVKPRASCRTT